ncbi:50S ribosomal protein L35 [bacterium]|nr:50S ribosomal protein L35 [bacterium]
MPKMKSHGGAKKRLRLTASGKIKRPRAGASHLLTGKDRRRKRRLCSPVFIESGAVYKRLRRLITV